MSFETDEKRRLATYAAERFDVDSHVLPTEIATENLIKDIRHTALEYFKRNDIKWWTGTADHRPKGHTGIPTGHLNSSQVACVNHLEAARIDIDIANQIIANADPTLSAVELDDGYVEYEWIGRANYLGEKGNRTRGANVTSLDALMVGTDGTARKIVVVEWKYLEKYPNRYIGISRHGTDRVATYRPLLQQPDCPIQVEHINGLFHNPYDQIMRQTLLAWQMTEHSEFGATDWIHVEVVPEGNAKLRLGQTAPALSGDSLQSRWQSALKEPARYRVMTPTELVGDTRENQRWGQWRQELAVRYLT